MTAPMLYVIQAQPFLPDDAAEWSGFITGLVLFLITIIGVFVKMGRDRQKWESIVESMGREIDRRFKEHGERIGKQEGFCAGQTEAITECKRLYSVQEMEQKTTIRDFGELRGAGIELKEQINAFFAAMTEAMTLVRERIATLEERTRGK